MPVTKLLSLVQNIFFVILLKMLFGCFEKVFKNSFQGLFSSSLKLLLLCSAQVFLLFWCEVAVAVVVHSVDFLYSLQKDRLKQGKASKLLFCWKVGNQFFEGGRWWRHLRSTVILLSNSLERILLRQVTSRGHGGRVQHWRAHPADPSWPLRALIRKQLTVFEEGDVHEARVRRVEDRPVFGKLRPVNKFRIKINYFGHEKYV